MDMFSVGVKKDLQCQCILGEQHQSTTSNFFRAFGHVIHDSKHGLFERKVQWLSENQMLGRSFGCFLFDKGNRIKLQVFSDSLMAWWFHPPNLSRSCAQLAHRSMNLFCKDDLFIIFEHMSDLERQYILDKVYWSPLSIIAHENHCAADLSMRFFCKDEVQLEQRILEKEFAFWPFFGL